MSDFSTEHDVVTPLAEDACWAFLAEHAFGRLAYALGGEVQIAPINYVTDDGAIVFRTAEGNKLLAVAMNESREHGDVAFEVDDFAAGGRFGDGEASSVIVRGRAAVLEGADKARAEQLPLRPWVPTQKHVIVRIAVTEISGRRFQLSKPWTHMHP